MTCKPFAGDIILLRILERQLLPGLWFGMRSGKQDVLSEDGFARLLAATDDLREPFDREAMLILVCGGRLGMRAGEICHMQKSWVNHNRGLIDIPQHSPCDCGYCRSCAAQSHQKSGVDEEEDFAERWKPKTSDSARSIPFTFDDQVAAVIELFFEEFDEYPHSRVSVNRRIDRVAEAAGMDTENVYPHCLRATAATYHAYRGVPPVALQSMFGWSKLLIARHYIRRSGGATKDALDEIYSD